MALAMKTCRSVSLWQTSIPDPTFRNFRSGIQWLCKSLSSTLDSYFFSYSDPEAEFSKTANCRLSAVFYDIWYIIYIIYNVSHCQLAGNLLDDFGKFRHRLGVLRKAKYFIDSLAYKRVTKRIFLTSITIKIYLVEVVLIFV